MDIDFFPWSQPVGVFTFVLAIILIGSLFSWLKTKSQQETIREAIRSGVTLDPEMLKDLDAGSGGRGGLVLGGLVCIGVSIALAFFGYQIEKVEGDEQVFQIFLGIAGFPFMVGIVLLAVGLFRKATASKD